MPDIIPTLGRIVYYRLTIDDVRKINARRRDGREKFHMHQWQHNGTVVHNGNEVQEGQVVPMMIVAVWGNTPQSCINGQAFLDGNDTYWVTSTSVGEDFENGKYHWMPYQKGQAAKTEALEAQVKDVK